MLINSWDKASENFKDNLAMILALEKEKPGITKRLFERFNIRNFARYPIEVLMAQDSESQISNRPYGIILYPLADHNRAFHRVGVIKELYGQIEGRYGLIIIEAGSKLEALHFLNRVRKQCGRAKFGIIGGHGTDCAIQLGGFPGPRSFVNLEDILRQGAQALKLVLEDDTTIILVSCKTEVEGGIAQEISKQFPKLKIIASSKPTNIKSLKVTVDEGGKLNFAVEYSTEDALVSYVSGKKKLDVFN